ncbi:MAG TPA: HNH endonuclease signature motif containing protein, partial [Candidatus Sulfotelmatobacter sp.]|nr:HNH endonuclease signature motif containing protein [Candidatus Sulfotelmatobacter sp.]
MIDVIDSRGRVLTPCRRKVAEREVRLNRAKWIGPNRIRLRFDPFAYRYIRLKVLARDRNTCYWCGEAGDTMDHITPWSKGGRTTMDNCICACQECNG